MTHGYGYFEEERLGQVGDLGLWRRIIVYIGPHWRRVSVAIGLSLIITACELSLPYIIRQGIDRYIMGRTMGLEARIGGLGELALLFLAISAAGFVANFFQVVVLEWAGQKIMHALRQHVFSHLLTLRLAFFNANPVGKLVTRLTNDIQNMYEMFTSVIVTLFNEAVNMVGIMAILFWMNWRLALLLFSVIPVMLLITAWFGRLSREAFRKIRTRLARINAFLQETVSGMTVIQLFLREKDTNEKFKDLNWSHFRAAMYQIKVFGVFVPVIEVMSSVSMALIIWYGGGEMIRSHMTLGVLVAFISYIRQFFQPIRELSQKYTVVQSAMASAERIFELLDAREGMPEARSPLAPERIRGAIEFDHVRFGYDPARPVLGDFSIRIEPGETLAIVGATGAGKTTLINLLERFYDPDQGLIRMDGLDLGSLDVRWLRGHIGLIMQEVFIIPGTVRENIALDHPISDEDLERVLELSRLSRVVGRLPRGPDSRIGEGGMDLSAGQKQLLAFARVLARDPRILVLDEATANIDTETEMLIERAIQATLANRTSIVIAHRLSTIRRADRIIVMDHGKIIEEGTHESLMALTGVYRHLQTIETFAKLDETVVPVSAGVYNAS